MHQFLRRALAASLVSACVAAAGFVAIPTALAAIEHDVLASNAQSFRLGAAAAASGPARDEFTVSSFTVVHWPLRAGTAISSTFGARSCSGCSSFHSGVDFTPGAGTPVQAIADGVVVGSSVVDGSWGVHVTLRHDVDGVTYFSSYAHLQSGSMGLSLGDTVARGQVVGRVGNTGQSYGAHLHFTIQTADRTFIDPVSWMREHVTEE